MSSLSRRIAIALAATCLAGSAYAQDIGGTVGGIVGGIGGALSGPVGDAINVVSDSPVGNTVGGVMGGPAGGGFGGLGSSPISGTIGTLSSTTAWKPDNGAWLQNLLGLDPELTRPTLDSLGPSEIVERLDAPSLAAIRKLRLEALVSDYPRILDIDGAENPVRRGELIGINPDAASLAAARAAGFTFLRAETNSDLGMTIVTLATPKGQSTRAAMKQLRKIAPRMTVEYDHVYEPAGGALAPSRVLRAARGGPTSGIRIAMIDGAVASHPSFASARIEQRAFAGPPQATGHGTAVASLLVGNQGPFHGAARGATLFVADVYGGNRSAGSASAIVKALAWAASKHPQVINISLVGPQNALLQQAIASIVARGIPVVAAVGNDGPAAPPQYPASYPNVIAVTGVDASSRALPEAGRAKDLDFAAPGADMIAALPGRDYIKVRGTSFAAPLAAARVALAGSAQELALEARPGKGRVGRGIVCGDCRISPKLARAK
ncbi:MAG TPA: S8 family serine peptidase [Sphingomicrobium sp.]|nr:S8 family serine peptidase [Sphingomicrobium sp.]